MTRFGHPVPVPNAKGNLDRALQSLCGGAWRSRAPDPERIQWEPLWEYAEHRWYECRPLHVLDCDFVDGERA